MPRRTIRFRAVWIGFIGCGLVVLVVLVVVVVSIVAVAIELVAVIVSGVALFIYFKGVFSSVLSEIDILTSFYKKGLYRAKCLCYVFVK